MIGAVETHRQGRVFVVNILESCPSNPCLRQETDSKGVCEVARFRGKYILRQRMEDKGLCVTQQGYCYISRFTLFVRNIL
ncbi:hypothetical protein LCGC14_2050030 [marine sediment metagenome]|uniref:Uncharacterized protein n=1 Tax=marine sediment metagenome TaxID=412755 RepID=A0A0F9EP98_9ZZZZ